MPAILEIGFAAFLVAVVVLNCYVFQRARQQLRDWAASNAFILTSAQLCYFWRGPFFLRSSRGHLVYRITISTPDHHTRHAYARIGTWWRGPFGKQVAIVWDDQPDQIIESA